MSVRLNRTIRNYIAKNGIAGMANLSVAAGRSQRTIQRWLQKGFPSAHEAYITALACGVGEREALAMANECFPSESKRTA